MINDKNGKGSVKGVAQLARSIRQLAGEELTDVEADFSLARFIYPHSGSL